MDKEFLLNNTFNYINTQDDIVDIKIVSIEHYYDNYYLAYYYFIENGKELIDDVHDAYDDVDMQGFSTEGKLDSFIDFILSSYFVLNLLCFPFTLFPIFVLSLSLPFFLV